MSIAIVQRKSALSTSTVSARTLVFDSTPTTGGTVIVIIASSMAVGGVTDSVGNVYVRDLHDQVQSGCVVSVWRSAAFTGAATFTVTATLVGTGTRRLLWGIVEVDKPLVLDRQTTKRGVSTTASVGPLAGQTLNTEQYGVAMVNSGAGSSLVFVPPSSWTMILNSSTGLRGQLSDRVFTPTSETTVSWSLSALSVWTTGLAVYTDSSAVPIPTEPQINYRPLNFFDPRGPMGRFPGEMAFLLAHQPPPLITPPVTATAGPKKTTLVPRLSAQDQYARLQQLTRKIANLVNGLLRAQYLHRVSEDVYAIRGGGFSSTREPTETDDSTIGALAGVPWVMGTEAETARAWICADATVDAAVWIELTLAEGASGVGGATGTFPSG